MKYNEFIRWLKKQGCTFDKKRGKGSHVLVRRGKKFSFVPIHGSKEIPSGTLRSIKKNLGLDE